MCLTVQTVQFEKFPSCKTMLSFLVYATATVMNKNLTMKHQILIAICILIEMTFICYQIGDDPVFITFVKFITVCLILIPIMTASDKGASIEFEGCFRDSYKSSTQYQYLNEMRAYDQYAKYKTSECGICFDEFKFNSNSHMNRLLQCGHMYHTDCIRKNEIYAWDNHQNELLEPFGRCPLCRTHYNVNREKFKFDPNYGNHKHPMQSTWKTRDISRFLSGL
eukprot:159471_1